MKKNQNKLNMILMLLIVVSSGLITSTLVQGGMSDSITLIPNQADKDYIYNPVISQDDLVTISWSIAGYEPSLETVYIKWYDESWINMGDSPSGSESRLASSFTSYDPEIMTFIGLFYVKIYNSWIGEYILEENIRFTIHHYTDFTLATNIPSYLQLNFEYEIYVEYSEKIKITYDNLKVEYIFNPTPGTTVSKEIFAGFLKEEGINNGKGMCFSKHEVKLESYVDNQLKFTLRVNFYVKWVSGTFSCEIYEWYTGKIGLPCNLQGEIYSKTTNIILCRSYCYYYPYERATTSITVNTGSLAHKISVKRKPGGIISIPYIGYLIKDMKLYFRPSGPPTNHYFYLKMQASSGTYNAFGFQVDYLGSYKVGSVTVIIRIVDLKY